MITKIVRTTLASLPLLAILLVVAEFIATNELAGLGQKVQAADTEIESLREENEVLRQQVASASSLVTIRDKAAKLGFSELPKYIVIGQETVALHEP